ncbi:MAG: thioredoxin [Bacteroidota bacterium]
MKKLVYICAFLLIVSCKSNKEEEAKPEEVASPYAKELATPSSETDFNKLTLSEEDEEILLGLIDRKGLQREQFKTWFDSSYREHRVDTSMIELINPLIVEKDIRIFMGTWCEDSQREVPAFFNLLDELEFDTENLYLTAVSRNKTTPQGYEEGYNIEYVPTIIFLEGETELGRIVEYPQESLEKDIYAILSGAGYKHSYED